MNTNFVYSVEKVEIKFDDTRKSYYAVFFNKYNNIISTVNDFKSITISDHTDYYVVIIKLANYRIYLNTSVIATCTELSDKKYLNLEDSFFGKYFCYYSFS